MDLKMEVTQTLGLSQRMIQSTEILQMSAQELDTYLKELAVENPVVDIEEKFDKSRAIRTGCGAAEEVGMAGKQ